MPDSSVKYVHVMAHALSHESGGVEFVGAVMDVSDRKRAEEELRRSEALAEQRLRLVVDTTPAMINSCRPDGYLDYVNKGWLDYFGFSLETALDRADVMKMSVPSKTDILGMDYRLPVPTVHIGFRRHGHFHHVGTVQRRLQGKPEIIQPTFIYVIKVTIRTATVNHCGSCIHHKAKTLFRKSFTSPEVLFRTLTVADVHYRSDKLHAARFMA